MNATENSDKFKGSLKNQGENSDTFLILCSYFIVNMPFYKLQTRKEIEIKDLLQSLI